MGKDEALGAPSKTQRSSQSLKPNLDGSNPVPGWERSPLSSSAFPLTEAAALLASRRPRCLPHTGIFSSGPALSHALNPNTTSCAPPPITKSPPGPCRCCPSPLTAPRFIINPFPVHLLGVSCTTTERADFRAALLISCKAAPGSSVFLCAEAEPYGGCRVWLCWFGPGLVWHHGGTRITPGLLHYYVLLDH